ncbi:xanthine dehydrogenase family protein molybdopterin-binding subunit [Undibacterium cyanobacteriorum]|uniref:Xanthine dehydrogenase family protein molybdopterin-binding subunit n=1 Tax=Undibacterium cyanobacteriorum TaxID=3073561 RepID=A0ABY9RFI7_9BURK|nr:xanthine dehydrogenase family protein molybdopterin-binding subunit [Undibacterium sp. 20NA77.5]WMW78911.1 xanthine dehydrogenase family protein molybdopterin-binding subunit [Undibacterium sp. 20NA77.5]
MNLNSLRDTEQLPRVIRQYLASQNSKVDHQFERRQFLKLSLGAGLSLGFLPLSTSAQENSLKAFQQPQAFVQIRPDNSVNVTINRLEFGQGIQTALAMILAEELDADWNFVTASHGNADPAYVDPLFGMHSTGGSGSVKNSFTQYRELGARARAMLIAAAAKHWGVAPNSVSTQSGKLINADGKELTYGAMAEAAMHETVPEKIKLKDAKDFRLIGKKTGRLDARSKSTGTQNFGIDVRRPNMLTALIAHPLVFGARIKSFDDGATKKITGVKAVVRIPADRGGEAIAVIAEGFYAAKLGRDALKVDWDTAGLELVDSSKQRMHYRALAKTPGKKKYDADVSVLGSAAHQIEAEYYFPYLAHAAMEPLNCCIEIQGEGAQRKVDIWVASQMPGMDSMALAQVLGIKPDQVHIHVEMSGGGFGRRAIPTCDYVVESAHVVKAAHAQGIRNPIQVIWTREDDMRAGYYRPSHLHHAKLGFDAKGDILAWDHVVVGQSIVQGSPFEGFLMKDGIDGTIVEGMRDPYRIPMRLSVHHPKQNVPVLWWRSVGSTHTAYVMETLIDEVARKTKQDPVAYRLRLFGENAKRHQSALQLAVEKSGYGKRKLAKGEAWGVAVHESFDTVVAYVVTATIRNGQAQLKTVTAGVHCNLAVNPRTIEAQIQGAAVMALSTCLPGSSISLKNGEVEQSNFHEYRVARMNEVPDIDVYIVPSADAPTGIGEPGLPPLAPAFANAIAKLTGKTPRELPFKLL